MTPDSQWLNVQDVADILQIKNETVRRWIRRNELPVLELGGPRAGYRIRRDDLDRFIWKRYRLRNQDEADREHRSDIADSTSGASSSPPARDESSRGDPRSAKSDLSNTYSSLVRHIPGITYASTADPESGEGIRRRIAFVSHEFEALLGGMARRIQERDQAWWDMVHPDDRQRVQASRRHSYRTGERLSLEYRVVPPHINDPIWVRDEAVLGDDSGQGDPVWQGIVLDISDRKRVEHTLHARIRQQEIVAELGDHALQRVDLPTLLKEAVQYVSQTLETNYVHVLELQPGGDTLLMRAGVGWRPASVGRLTVSAGPDSQTGYTLLSSEPVIVADLREEKRFSGPSFLHDHGARSGVSVIIAGSGKPFGVIGAHTTSVRKFTAEDVAFLQSVANVLASAALSASSQTDGGKWLSIRDVSETLRVKEETVRRWIRRGELPVIDLGSARAGYRVHPVDLEHFINERYMKP